jgi:hypothetical protein
MVIAGHLYLPEIKDILPASFCVGGKSVLNCMINDGHSG